MANNQFVDNFVSLGLVQLMKLTCAESKENEVEQ